MKSYDDYGLHSTQFACEDYNMCWDSTNNVI